MKRLSLIPLTYEEPIIDEALHENPCECSEWYKCSASTLYNEIKKINRCVKTTFKGHIPSSPTFYQHYILHCELLFRHLQIVL